MGQRTAIVLKYKSKNGENHTRVFYHQWGIGRITPCHIMSIMYATMSANSYSKDFPSCLKPAGMYDNTECFEGEEKELLEKASFETPEIVGNIIKNIDNNNGGAYLEITEGSEIGELHFRYAFMLGYEEGGDYKSFVTAKEWMKKTGETFVDEDFLKLFDDTMNYFDAKDYVESSKVENYEFEELVSYCKALGVELNTIVKENYWPDYGFGSIIFMTDNFECVYMNLYYNIKTREVVNWYGFPIAQKIETTLQLKDIVKQELEKELKSRNMSDVSDFINSQH